MAIMNLMKTTIFYGLIVSGSCIFSGILFTQETNHSNIVVKEKASFTKLQKQPPSLPFNDYLFTIGEKLGCFFTLEYFSYAHAGKSSKIHGIVTNDLSIQSIPALVEKLRHDMQGFVIEQDGKNPKILHIIDEALKNDKNYAMNKMVSLNYSGTLGGCDIFDANDKAVAKTSGLISAISKQLDGIQYGTETSGSQGAISDCITLVNVNSTNTAVRSILTDSIALDNYKVILWRSFTTYSEKGKTCQVQFFGPKK